MALTDFQLILIQSLSSFPDFALQCHSFSLSNDTMQARLTLHYSGYLSAVSESATTYPLSSRFNDAHRYRTPLGLSEPKEESGPPWPGAGDCAAIRSPRALKSRTAAGLPLIAVAKAGAREDLTLPPVSCFPGQGEQTRPHVAA